MTHLTDGEVARIAQYACERKAIDDARDLLELSYGAFLDELIGRNDAEVDAEVEKMLPGGYWQFEFRVRMRYLARKATV